MSLDRGREKGSALLGILGGMMWRRRGKFMGLGAWRVLVWVSWIAKRSVQRSNIIEGDGRR